MRANIKLGNIWGIPIGINASWFLVFALVTFTLANGQFNILNESLGAGVWVLALVASLLFFGSVLAHELGHAWVALRNNIPVQSIVLFMFGGVAQIEKQPETAGAEFRIAIAGPLVSILVGGLFLVLAWLTQSLAFLSIPLFWLGQINIILAVFNMIPGFPLDGGRVLRAGIWWWTESFERATNIASTMGQVVAYGFFGLGLFSMLTGNLVNGLWIIFIGFFLRNAAVSNARQAFVEYRLKNLAVADIMDRQWPSVSSRTPLSLIVNDYIMRGSARYFLVERDGYWEDEVIFNANPYGMLSSTDIMKVATGQRPFIPARDVMTAWEELITTAPGTNLLDAMQLMQKEDVQQLPVVENNQLVGILSRNQIARYLRFQNSTQ